MPRINIQIKNLDEIRAAFHLAPRLMTQELNKAILKSSFEIEKESKKNTPVLTGRLRASHRTTISPLRGEISPTANYAIYVHEGTYKMRARPFLANAVKTVDTKVQDYFHKAVQNVLDDIGRIT